MTDFLNTPTTLNQHVLHRDGCPLHYWVGGPAERPLLVFMHGATMDHCMFNAQVEAFAPHYRLLVWDARGHGWETNMSYHVIPNVAHNANHDNPEFTNRVMQAFLESLGD